VAHHLPVESSKALLHLLRPVSVFVHFGSVPYIGLYTLTWVIWWHERAANIGDVKAASRPRVLRMFGGVLAVTWAASVLPYLVSRDEFWRIGRRGPTPGGSGAASMEFVGAVAAGIFMYLAVAAWVAWIYSPRGGTFTWTNAGARSLIICLLTYAAPLKIQCMCKSSSP